MKQLLITFFAIVLCYSLFFNNSKVPSAVDEVNYIEKDTSKSDVFLTQDSLYYCTCQISDYWSWNPESLNIDVPYKY